MNRIHSDQKTGFWKLWLFGSVFVLISLPVMNVLPRELDKGNWAVLVALLFPLVGFWIIGVGVRQYREWRFFGPAPLMPDPAPGALNGDIGGSIRVQRTDAPDTPPRVTLQLIQVSYRGTGRNRRRQEDIEWQADSRAYPEQEAGGTRLGFVFQPPPDAPPTRVDRHGGHYWRLLLDGQWGGRAMHRSYRLDVQPSDARSGVRIPESFQLQASRADSIQALERVQGQIRVDPIAGGLKLFSPALRNPAMAVSMIVFGLIFAGVGAFILHREGMGLTSALFVPAFGGLGVFLTLGGIVISLRSLEAQIRDGQVRTLRRLAGIALYTRQSPIPSEKALELKRSGSMTKGNHKTEFFHLLLKGPDRKLRLAEDIAGRAEAEALQESLASLIRSH